MPLSHSNALDDPYERLARTAEVYSTYYDIKYPGEEKQAGPRGRVGGDGQDCGVQTKVGSRRALVSASLSSDRIANGRCSRSAVIRYSRARLSAVVPWGTGWPARRKVAALRRILEPRGFRVVAPDLNIPSFERLDFRVMSRVSLWEMKKHLRATIAAGYADDDFMALFQHLRSASRSRDQEVVR